jgi:hypothetical protein
MKTTLYIIKHKGINPPPFTPRYEATRDSGSVDLVYLGAAPYKADGPHDQYWLKIPCYPSTSPTREGVASHLARWADHSKAVAECVAQAAAEIVSGDYLVHGLGNPYPLHVSNIPELRGQIGSMSL